MDEENIARIVVDSALKVHRKLGPGLLESSYEAYLAFELKQRELKVEIQKPLPLVYEEIKLEAGYRVDLMVENKFVIEIKSVEALNDVHLAQLLTYLKLSNSKLGLLINFNVSLLKNGLRRVINKDFIK